MTKQKIRTTGEVLSDGTIIEMVYREEKSKTELLIKDGKKIVTCDQFKQGDKIYLPYSETNNLIKNKIVRLPQQATQYNSYQGLINDIEKYIYKYVDLDPLFHKLCTYYVLLSWVYDGFNQLPYFRKCGDFGTGKTRFLTVIGSICYKPIFASGSSSTAALFHTLDKFRGTLIFDEADFRFSDEKADLTKVLNSGFMKGYPILRCSFNKNKEFDPMGYQVYGCKIIASRKHFSDPALESRFITEKTSFKHPRPDIPNELPEIFEKESQELQNKLLMFRFDMLNNIKQLKTEWKMENVEPRVNQIFSPLMQLAINDDFRKQLTDLAVQYSKQIQKDRSTSIEYHVLSALNSLLKENAKVSVGDVANMVLLEYSDFHDRRITAKWIGYVVSKTLNIRTHRVSGKFYISKNQEENLKSLYVRYGVI